jgi:hypothetical protein
LSSQSSNGSGISSNVNTSLLLEVFLAEIDDSVIEVLSTKMSVAISSFDLEDTFLNGEEGDIESTTTKIEDKDISLLLGFLVESISDSCSSRLVDDSKNVEASNSTSILSGLSLGVIEVSWDSDDSILHLL